MAITATPPVHDPHPHAFAGPSSLPARHSSTTPRPPVSSSSTPLTPMLEAVLLAQQGPPRRPLPPRSLLASSRLPGLAPMPKLSDIGRQLSTDEHGVNKLALPPTPPVGGMRKKSKVGNRKGEGWSLPGVADAGPSRVEEWGMNERHVRPMASPRGDAAFRAVGLAAGGRKQGMTDEEARAKSAARARGRSGTGKMITSSSPPGRREAFGLLTPNSSEDSGHHRPASAATTALSRAHAIPGHPPRSPLALTSDELTPRAVPSPAKRIKSGEKTNPYFPSS